MRSPSREWSPDDLTGGPLDDILREARRTAPGLRVRRPTVPHPGDDDNVYVLTVGSWEERVQLDTGRNGGPTFVVDGVDVSRTVDPAEALAAVRRELAAAVPPED
ncbi:hypothetical protein ABTZ03_05795 [Kitasatospora sp. NPDC096077]|uniref:hypothetical protein n=1 Tax=Kitasatospora sp. NPDC096077 TaxID=3155544 RepID=UPI0033320808